MYQLRNNYDADPVIREGIAQKAARGFSVQTLRITKLSPLYFKTMNYKRIQPFPSTHSYEFSELRALSSVWRERKAALEEDGAYKEFIKKLQREWAIETGIIERLYTWDRGVTEVLIEQGIEASIIAHRGGVSQRDAEHIQTLINDHLGIVEGLFSYIKGEEPLTEHFIRGLQAQFTANQDYTEAITEAGEVIRVTLQKGEYKTLPNNEPPRELWSVSGLSQPHGMVADRR